MESSIESGGDVNDHLKYTILINFINDKVFDHDWKYTVNLFQFSTSARTFQLERKFPTSEGSFLFRSVHCNLNLSKNFPTKQSNYMYPLGLFSDMKPVTYCINRSCMAYYSICDDAMSFMCPNQLMKHLLSFRRFNFVEVFTVFSSNMLTSRRL